MGSLNSIEKNRLSFLLIGGGGFMGKAFGEFLNEASYQQLPILKGEISDKSIVDNIKARTDKHHPVIVDFAYTSVPNTSYKDPVRDFSENLYNVIQHLEFARTLPDATYVYISSGGTVYGNVGTTLIKETQTNVPLSPYGITKLACERYVLMYKEVYGLDVRIVRPGNIYGPGQLPFRGQGLVATALAKALLHHPIQVFGDGLPVRDYLYIDDFCKLLLNVVLYGENGELYNIGSGQGFTISDVVRKIITLTDSQSDIESLPSRPFDVPYNVLDTAKAASLHHWRPAVSFDQGLLLTLPWMKKFLASTEPSRS